MPLKPRNKPHDSIEQKAGNADDSVQTRVVSEICDVFREEGFPAVNYGKGELSVVGPFECQAYYAARVPPGSLLFCGHEEARQRVVSQETELIPLGVVLHYDIVRQKRDVLACLPLRSLLRLTKAAESSRRAGS